MNASMASARAEVAVLLVDRAGDQRLTSKAEGEAQEQHPVCQRIERAVAVDIEGDEVPETLRKDAATRTVLSRWWGIAAEAGPDHDHVPARVDGHGGPRLRQGRMGVDLELRSFCSAVGVETLRKDLV